MLQRQTILCTESVKIPAYKTHMAGANPEVVSTLVRVPSGGREEGWLLKMLQLLIMTEIQGLDNETETPGFIPQ